jgi:hypothetical protein
MSKTTNLLRFLAKYGSLWNIKTNSLSHFFQKKVWIVENLELFPERKGLRPYWSRADKLLMLKLVSNKIDTYLTSLWRHERYLFSVFRGILPAIFRRFSKKLSTFFKSCTRKIFYQIIKINKTQMLLKYFFGFTRC